MRSRRDIAVFAALFVALSLVLGWLVFDSDSPQVGVSMLAVPVVSAMLAARGFSLKRQAHLRGNHDRALCARQRYRHEVRCA